MMLVQRLIARMRALIWPFLSAICSNSAPATSSSAKGFDPPSDTCPTVPEALEMSTAELQKTLSHLQSTSPPSPQKVAALLTTAKKQLLQLNALLPTSSTPPPVLSLARQTLETGALLSIRLQDPDAFTRYFQQLQPFYEVPSSNFKPAGDGQRSKVTGLYLLLLLTKGDYAGFHTVIEGLEVEKGGHAVGDKAGPGLEADKFIGYPVKLERWLMEGSYDRVWAATKREGVPGEEFGVFSEVRVTPSSSLFVFIWRLMMLNTLLQVLIGTIRSEIASCSEKAYPSLPIANAKNLLFLESEGSVVEFAGRRDWVVRDGRIYFPLQQGEDTSDEKDMASEAMIANTIGYARELETIV